MLVDQPWRNPEMQNIHAIRWLFTDQRTAATLESDIADLPAGSGVIFRHYHLPLPNRQRVFEQLRRVYMSKDLTFIWSGSHTDAVCVDADGYYGPAQSMARQALPERHMLKMATVHNLAELRQANGYNVDGVFVSPVFPTQSHKDAVALGVMRFAAIVRHAKMPVYALGGISARNCKRIAAFSDGWGAIDSLSKSPML